MEAITLLTFVALIKKVVDTFKFITNKQVNAFITQVSTWVVGSVLVWVATSADITSSISVFGTTFGQFNFGSIILGGMLLGSGGSVLYDYQAARDNTDSAKTSALLPNK